VYLFRSVGVLYICDSNASVVCEIKVTYLLTNLYIGEKWQIKGEDLSETEQWFQSLGNRN